MRRSDEWIALFFLGLVLFNWPFLHVFSNSQYYYFFVIWFVLIALVFVATLVLKDPPEE